MLLIDDSFEAAAALGKHSPMTLLILVVVAQAESSKKFLVTNGDAKRKSFIITMKSTPGHELPCFCLSDCRTFSFILNWLFCCAHVKLMSRGKENS